MISEPKLKEMLQTLKVSSLQTVWLVEGLKTNAVWTTLPQESRLTGVRIGQDTLNSEPESEKMLHTVLDP